MTLNTTYNPTVADGNGTTKEFSYNFNPLAREYLKVSFQINNEWVEQKSGWSATVSENGGVVTFDIAPTTRVAIERDVPEEQPTQYKTSSGFQAEVIEHSFDLLTGMVQELKDASDRSVKVEVGDNQTPEELLQTVYDKLDSATEIAGDAISAANQAQTAADNATAAVNSAEQTLANVTAYVDSAKVDIDSTVAQAKADVNSAIDEATMDISNIVSDAEGSITNIAVTEANKAIANAAQEATDMATASLNSYVDGTVKPSLQTYVDQAQEDANSAATSMEQAALSATAASNYASNASADADNAAESAELAANSASEASIHNFKNKITNCITEIPQDIKLELKDGVLTLKAGSKVYIPNGFESDGTTKKFDEVVISSDRIFSSGSGWSTDSYFFVVNPNSELTQSINVYSGSSTPSDFDNYAIWYDTTNNLIKYTTNAGSTWTGGYSLPVGIVLNSTGNKFSSISQVFNGFGYIGSTVFALPGVKGLIPNGRNADGCLKNIEFTLDKVSTYNCTMSSYFGIKIEDTGPILGIYGEQLYNSSSNTVIFNGIVHKWMYSGSLIYSNGRITSFAPKTVFHALDYNESSRLESVINNKVNKFGDTMTGNLIINGYIPAYILQDINLDLSQKFTENKGDMYFLERDKNGKDGCFVTFRHDTSDSNILELVASNGIDLDRKQQGMGIWIRKNGEHGTFAPQCNFDASIVTTASHGDNWIRFGNGLQICWGAGNNGQWTFPVPFKDANYGLTMSTQTSHGGEIWIVELSLSNKTNTGFYKADSAKTNPFTWTAIGYWY